MKRLFIMSQDGSKLVPYGAIKVKEVGIFRKSYLIIVQYTMGIGTITSIVGEFASELAAKQVIGNVSKLLDGNLVTVSKNVDGKILSKMLNSNVMIVGDTFGDIKVIDGDRVYQIPKEMLDNAKFYE